MLAPDSESIVVSFTDRIVAKSLRVSLKKTNAVSWLGEICVQINIVDEKTKGGNLLRISLDCVAFLIAHSQRCGHI
jgi:hypothetical protein